MKGWSGNVSIRLITSLTWTVNLVDALAKQLGLTDLSPVDPELSFKFDSDDLDAINGVIDSLENAIAEVT